MRGGCRGVDNEADEPSPVAGHSVRENCSDPNFARLALFAVEHIADRVAPGSVQFGVAGTKPGAGSLGLLRFAAGRAAVGEPRLAGTQLEFLSADCACFDRKRHSVSMVKPGGIFFEPLPSGHRVSVTSP